MVQTMLLLSGIVYVLLKWTIIQIRFFWFTIYLLNFYVIGLHMFIIGGHGGRNYWFYYVIYIVDRHHTIPIKNDINNYSCH